MRTRIKPATVAALALAIGWTPAALAEPILPPTFTPVPTPESTPGPTHVLQAPSRVGRPELRELAGILASAGEASVVLRVPGSATIEASKSDLSMLADAADGADFYVVQQQGDASLDGAAAILSAFADAGFRQPDSDPASGAPGELWPTVQLLTDCAQPCPPSETTNDAPWVMGLGGGSPTIEADLGTSYGPLTEALDAPAPPEDGGGVAKLLATGLLLMLVGGGLAAVALARRRRRDETEAPVLVAHTSSPPPAGDGPRAPAPPPGPPAPRPPAPTGRARRAKVVSVLGPEGYVELDRCLQRARWASSGTRPATPGEWVEIERRGKRLWAYAASRSTAPGLSRGA